MPLNKNKLSIPFSQGLATKSDNKQSQFDGFRRLENVLFETPEKLIKRNGYNSITPKLTDDTEIINTNLLTTFNDELGLITDTNYFNYINTLNRWSDKGLVFTAFPESTSIVRNEKNQKNIDLLSLEGFDIFVYEDNSGVRYSIVDNTNNSSIISNALVAANATVPKLSSIQSVIYIFYSINGILKYKSLNLSNPSVLSSEVDFNSSLSPGKLRYDLAPAANKIFAALTSETCGSTTDLANNLKVCSNEIGPSRNGDTITFQVEPAATNPSDTVLIDTSGDLDNTTITITPNNGDLNPVNNLATATLNLTDDIILTNVQTNGVPDTYGSARNGTTLTTNVNAPAANPTDEVLVDVTGTADDIDITVTPNDGTALSTPGQIEASFTGVGGTIIFTGITRSDGDTCFLVIENRLSGDPVLGGNDIIVQYGSRTDGVNSDGVTISILYDETSGITIGQLQSIINTGGASGVTSSISDPNSESNGQYLTLGSGANPFQTLLGNYSFNDLRTFQDQTIKTPIDLTTAELAELINTGDVAGKNITLTDASNLLDLQTASGGGSDILVNGGEGDNVVATFSGGTTVPVGLTTAEMAEFLNTDAVAGKNLTVTDASNLLTDLTASGGGPEEFADGGEGDGSSLTISGGLILQTLDSAENISSEIIIAGEDGRNGLDLLVDDQERVVLSYADALNAKIVVFNTALGVQLVPITVIEAISDLSNITLIQDSDTNYTVFYEVSAADSKDHYIKKSTVSTSGVVGTAAIIQRSVGLASKPAIINDNIYILSLHESTLQSTYFLLNEDGEIISKFSPNLGGNHISENSLPKVTKRDENTLVIPSQLKGRITVDDDEFFSLLGVNSTTVSFSINDPFRNEKLGQNLHIAGGILKAYDGARITEHGFHLFPEDLEAGNSSTTGGSMSDGVYQYVAVYAWTDNKGQLHRSAPSIGFQVELSGATDTQQQEIIVPTLRLTQKDNVVVELYRTENNGTLFYKVTDTSSPVINDLSTDTVTVTDTLSDADLLNNEVLYTTGGVLDNIAAPPSRLIESLNNRIFLAGLEDENRLQYSKIRFDGEPVEFNDALTIPVNAKGGAITAIAAMDEKLIIFKNSAMFYMSGNGPNNIGQQDTFTQPELISSDVGCINVSSVVLTPLGLMFKSQKGIYLLSRDMQLSYIGSDVEEFNDLEITSAIVVPQRNQVRFTTRTGVALVYNYNVNEWAAFSNHKALNAVNLNTVYHYLRPDDVIFVEDEESFTDTQSPVNIKLESNWISFAGVQGFQRVYKLLLLGDFKSPHKLRVQIAYDFNEAFTQEVVIDTADFTDNTRYGENSPYGTGSPYGGDGNVHQMRIDLKRQKCQAIKIKIEEIQNDSQNFGEGLSLSNIMFEVGQKVGTNKVDTGRKYGTE